MTDKKAISTQTTDHASQGFSAPSAKVFLVVIAGGSGTRFWPKSTSSRPKQLLSFGDQKHSLLAQTLTRFGSWIPANNRMVVTTEALSLAAAQTLTEENVAAEILAEPQGRNTAPCIYWAARKVAEIDPDAVMVVTPADHYIALPENLLQTVQQAAEWASKKDDLITLGLIPSRPETGYGYLKTKTSFQTSSSHELQEPLQTPFEVEAFVEKPNEQKALEYLKSGQYLWNSGMFIWRARVILEAFDQLMPQMSQAWQNAKGDIHLAYPEMTATSIDYGIMEKARNVVTFPVQCGWDDLGSWTSLENLAQALHLDKQGNTVSGGEVIALESLGNIIDAQNQTVCLLGVNDLIIVQKDDMLMIVPKSRAQEVKRLVEETKKSAPGKV